MCTIADTRCTLIANSFTLEVLGSKLLQVFYRPRHPSFPGRSLIDLNRADDLGFIAKHGC